MQKNIALLYRKAEERNLDEDGIMTQNLRLISKEEKGYTVIRLAPKTFAQEIISKSAENILRDYVYVETRRIIA